MKKTHQQSLLNAVIAVVLTIVSIIVALTFGVGLAHLTNEEVTFMGLPVIIIILVSVVFVVALVDYIRRRSDTSAMIATFILLITAAYIVVYKIGQTFLYDLFILLTTACFW